ncbi:hypothetical protein HMY34_14790 [Thiothrix subterranea]|jgi:hypothetical protein|uniref:glycosyltransferase n=1 Tax=Thiothrix subterranea TaxID=2735563 RepID=UPI00192B96D2|nr:glycosyltransferase [Thiothrix subterranea]QQZ29924.1 hypothetical protein HMY34_14790 [Thiothrix subterranea]
MKNTKSDNKIFIAIPRLANTGGNIISVYLSEILISKGYEVIALTGFSQKNLNLNKLKLKNHKKTKLNSILNYISYISISVNFIFIRSKRIATHHLTCLFNFLRPCEYNFVQDLELSFYPDKLKNIGNMLWKNYLKSEKIIFTNHILAKKCGYDILDIGFPFITDTEFHYYKYQQKNYDALIILRDGAYKAPQETLELFEKLKNKKKIIMINNSKINNNLTNGDNNSLILGTMSRKDFLATLCKSHYYICLSKWEGLGLPIIEAYLAGLNVISTPIPSAIIINNYQKNPNEIFIVNSNEEIDISLMEVFEKDQREKTSTERQEVIKQINKKWVTYINELF